MLHKLESWGATRLLESLWVFNSDLSASQIRDELQAAADVNDAFAVLELKPGAIGPVKRFARLEFNASAERRGLAVTKSLLPDMIYGHLRTGIPLDDQVRMHLRFKCKSTLHHATHEV